MANLLFLPNGKILCLNGAQLGNVIVNPRSWPCVLSLYTRNGGLWQRLLGYWTIIRGYASVDTRAL
jgi:hypothetical protein